MHYRDDQDALEARRHELRQELADLSSKAVLLRATERDRGAIERELAALEVRLSRTRRASPLESVRIASPCAARWEAMEGDDRVRFCGQCQKSVYDLSAMPRDEAERLLAERAGSMCVRLYKRADGTVLTADCPIGARKKRVRLAVLGAAGAGALAASATLFLHDRATATMGDVSSIMGVVAVPVDDYEREALPEAGEPGLVLVFWSEARDTEASTRWASTRWKVYADGRIVREIDAGPGPRIEAVPLDDVDHVGPMLRLAAQFQPQAFSAADRYQPAPARRAGVRVYGAGKRDATRADVEALLAEMRGIWPSFAR